MATGPDTDAMVPLTLTGASFRIETPLNPLTAVNASGPRLVISTLPDIPLVAESDDTAVSSASPEPIPA